MKIYLEKQHQDTINSFHYLHPFRVINYVRDDYKAFQTFEAQQLKCDFINDHMVNNYRELFFNFNNKGNHCNLCNCDVNNPLEYHLITSCPMLYGLRFEYWNHARFDFANCGKKYDHIHQQLFMQHLIKFCFNINDHKADFW